MQGSCRLLAIWVDVRFIYFQAAERSLGSYGADDRGLLRQLPGPGQPGIVLPGGCRGLPAAASISATARSARSRSYASPGDIDAVLISHLHVDHCIDMCSYQVFRTYHPDGPLPPIPVYAPAAAADRLDRAAGGDSGHPISDAFDFVTLTPGTIEIGPFAVTARHMNHPVETFGFRLEHDGRAIAYSADTGATDELVSAGSRRRRAALRGVLSRSPWPASRPAPDRARGRRARVAGRRRRAGADTSGAVE